MYTTINDFSLLPILPSVLRLLRRQSLECTSSFPSLIINNNINTPPALHQSNFFPGSQRRFSHFFDIFGHSPPFRHTSFPALDVPAVASSIFPTNPVVTSSSRNAASSFDQHGDPARRREKAAESGDGRNGSRIINRRKRGHAKRSLQIPRM